MIYHSDRPLMEGAGALRVGPAFSQMTHLFFISGSTNDKHLAPQRIEAEHPFGAMKNYIASLDQENVGGMILDVEAPAYVTLAVTAIHLCCGDK